MRITYVTETYPPEINGVALTAARTVSYLRDRGHLVDLIRPAQLGETKGDGEGEWLSVGWPIPMYSGLRFGVTRPAVLVRRFAQTRTELVHVATEGPLGCAAVAAARHAGLPTTSDFRTNFHRYSTYYGFGVLRPAIEAYLRSFHNATDLTFVPTLETRNRLERAGFERLCVVGRGVDLDRFSRRHRDLTLRHRWRVFGGGPVLLYVGRLAAEKRVDLALHAYRRARGLMPEVRMVVVGDGPRRSALGRAFPEALFLGVLTGAELAACYASADLFVFPSESETFGNVTLEALASGLPVIAFNSAAAGEHVVDGVNGRLVPPGNDETFITATCQMTSHYNPARAAAAAQASRDSVVHRPWNRILQEFEAHLQEIMDVAQHTRFGAAHAA